MHKLAPVILRLKSITIQLWAKSYSHASLASPEISLSSWVFCTLALDRGNGGKSEALEHTEVFRNFTELLLLGMAAF